MIFQDKTQPIFFNRIWPQPAIPFFAGSSTDEEPEGLAVSALTSEKEGKKPDKDKGRDSIHFKCIARYIKNIFTNS